MSRAPLHSKKMSLILYSAHFVDSLQGIACKQDELLLALNPSVTRVESFCENEYGCSDRYVDLEGRRQEAGCSGTFRVDICAVHTSAMFSKPS